ncbi:mitochondrial sodium/calcium exchanger protein-like isoform X2 [Drosophila novamexicana]|uniref:mitochondrial sodium/calcium exchanger protein-like isoform X2 n=1 Tax=Drosophila novamexicana TaxID=47314 RepID=UPI0011E59DE1|nr:mitochondrial sodium/calcium exchanger protein-like isoform X2 [Drosophila novamexicana]
MNQTFSLQDTYNTMSCFSVMAADYKDRCSLAMSVKNCGQVMNFFKYYEMLYCRIDIQNQVTELAMIIILVLIAIILMITTAYLVDKYFAPTLKIIAVKLNMNEYLAGVTLLAFGNTSPDLMANLMPVRRHAPLFTITISNSLALILISGGMVCYMRSFKINGHCALRDLLFVLLACELLIFVMLSETRMTASEGVVLISLYVVNLIVVLVDRKLVGLTIIKLHREIDLILNESITLERESLLRQKITLLRELKLDQILIVRHRHNEANLIPSSHSFSRTHSLNGFSTRKNSDLPPAVNLVQTRNSMYHPRNRRNKSLFMEFFKDLVPVDLDKWSERGWFRRTIEILLSPIALPCCIFIPVVDYSRKKHGWSKLLNCTQIITNPFMFIILTQAMISNEYDHWHLSIEYNYAKWSLVVTVPLAIVAFINTRTDKPPQYHIRQLLT